MLCVQKRDHCSTEVLAFATRRKPHLSYTTTNQCINDYARTTMRRQNFFSTAIVSPEQINSVVKCGPICDENFEFQKRVDNNILLATLHRVTIKRVDGMYVYFIRPVYARVNE